MSISSLTIENGNLGTPGAGINNAGTLTLSNDIITGNTMTGGTTGGSIYNSGSLGLSNSTVSGNSALYGGGIGNIGIMSITNSTIDNNLASGNGAGIENYGGTLTVSDSTVNNNDATGAAPGGGLMNYDSGSTAQMTLNNDTIYGNTAYSGAGVDNYGGNLTMNFDTVSGNSASFQGGGIAINSGVSTALQGSIVVGNSAGQDPNIGYQYGGVATINVANYNLFNNSTGFTISTGTGNVYSTTPGLASPATMAAQPRPSPFCPAVPPSMPAATVWPAPPV